MAAKEVVDEILLLLSVKLAQPGMLGDIVEAYSRLEPPDAEHKFDKEDVARRLGELGWKKYVFIYSGRRYMLTKLGERFVATAGLRTPIDARRLYLLKETRKRNHRLRSDTRNWPLKQRS